jgi:altronate hydrolase
MAGDIDLDAGRIVDGDVTLAEMGEEIYDGIVAAGAGEATASERRGNSEFAIRRAGQHHG